MKKVVIGLVGPIGCGKDAIGEAITKHFDAKVIAWADELYAQVADKFKVSAAFLQTRNTKELPQDQIALIHCEDENFVNLMTGELGYDIHEPRSPRFILQHWGTEYRRAQDPDYWVKKTAEQIDRVTESAVLISGTRFQNEIAMTRRLGGFLLHVSRPGFQKQNTHASEIDIPIEFSDWEIINDASLEALELKSIHLGRLMGLSLVQESPMNQSIKKIRRIV